MSEFVAISGPRADSARLTWQFLWGGGYRARNGALFREDLRGRLEKQISGGPLVAAGALGHEDRDHAGLGVDGEVGAVGSVVAEQAVAEVVAEAVVDLGFAGLFCSQFVQGGARQVAVAVEFAVVGEHEAVAEDVVRGGEQGGVAQVNDFDAPKPDKSWLLLYRSLVQSRLNFICAGACPVNGTTGPSGLKNRFWGLVTRPSEAGLSERPAPWASGKGTRSRLRRES
jgi:hypothetical protein